MKDPIKKFVEHHRAAFDHLEPPDGVLQRLRGAIAPAPTPKKSVFERYGRTAWLAAASLLIGLATVYLLLGERGVPLPNDSHMAARQPAAGTTDVVPSSAPDTAKRADAPDIVHEQPTRSAAPRRSAAADRALPALRPLGERLADSSSASTRLAAILEIEQAGRMDDALRAMLGRSLQTDGNTNVRLAALSVLSQHIHDQEVATLFANTLISQDDPLVQLGTVKVAARIDGVAVEEALFALARDPRTFLPVKDEAYAILLRRDRL